MSEYKISVFKFARNVVIGTLLIGFLFGGVGYLLSGTVGLFNMIPMGLIIGFFVTMILGYSMYVKANSYGGPLEGNTPKLVGEWWWFVKHTGDKNNHKSGH